MAGRVRRGAVVIALCLTARFASASPLPSSPTPSPSPSRTALLDALGFLVGEWEASGQGTPGQGIGRTAFARGVQDHVIVRTNVAEYPASGDKPASRHDDMMVIYAEGASVRADYYDSEGHVIRYAVRSPGAGEAVFESEPLLGLPRFRLSYKLNASGVLNGEFKIASPGQPETYKSYLSWQSRKARTPGK